MQCSVLEGGESISPSSFLRHSLPDCQTASQVFLCNTMPRKQSMWWNPTWFPFANTRLPLTNTFCDKNLQSRTKPRKAGFESHTHQVQPPNYSFCRHSWWVERSEQLTSGRWVSCADLLKRGVVGLVCCWDLVKKTQCSRWNSQILLSVVLCNPVDADENKSDADTQ